MLQTDVFLQVVALDEELLKTKSRKKREKERDRRETGTSVFPKLFKLADHTILQNILADQKIFQNQFCGPLVRNFVQKLPVSCSNSSKI